jgi:hypothetical protein
MLIREADQGGADQQFVRQRIHELTEIRHQVPASGDMAVQSVRQAGHHKDHQGDHPVGRDLIHQQKQQKDYQLEQERLAFEKEKYANERSFL